MMNNQSHYKNMIHKANFNTQPQKAFGGLTVPQQQPNVKQHPMYPSQHRPSTLPYDPFNRPPQNDMNSLLQPSKPSYEPSNPWGQRSNREPDTSFLGMNSNKYYERPREDHYNLFGQNNDRHSRHSSHRHRHRDRYSRSSSGSESTRYGRYDGDHSDSDSDSNHSRHHHRKRYEKDQRFRTLPSHYKRIIFEVLKEHSDDKMNDVVYDDVRKRIEELEEDGFKAPKGYNRDKHDFAAADMALMDQVSRRNRVRDQKKMQNLISLASMGLTWICQGFSIKWLRTEKLQDHIDEAIGDGEFDESSERIGMFLKGTIFENPIFNVALKFAQKAGQAHHEQISDESALLEEQEAERKKRQSGGSLNNLNAMRNATQSHNPSNLKTTGGPNPPSFSAPPPSVSELKEAGVPEKKLSRKEETPVNQGDKKKADVNPSSKKPRSFEPMKEVKMPDQMGNMLGGLAKPMQAFTKMQSVENSFNDEEVKLSSEKRAIDVFDQ